MIQLEKKINDCNRKCHDILDFFDDLGIKWILIIKNHFDPLYETLSLDFFAFAIIRVTILIAKAMLIFVNALWISSFVTTTSSP